MDWLELFAVDQLLFDGEILGGLFGTGAGFVSGFFIIAFAVIWLIMALFAPNLLRQCTTVGCLIPGIIILVMFIFNFILDILKKDKKLIIFDTICACLITIAFIKGFSVPYHSIQYNYEYIGIWSAIASTTWKTVLLTMIRSFLSSDNDGLFEKIGSAFTYFLSVILIFIVFILLSQPVAFFISFTKHDDFYNNFIRYNNAKITEQQKDMKYSSIDECLQQELPIEIKNHMDREIERSTNKEITVSETIKYYRPSGRMCYASDNAGLLVIDDKTVYYFLKDLETDRKEFYYSFDYNTYSITKITKEEYDSHRRK